MKHLLIIIVALAGFILASDSQAQISEKPDEDGCIKLMPTPPSRQRKCVEVNVGLRREVSYKMLTAQVTNNCQVSVAVAVCVEGTRIHWKGGRSTDTDHQCVLTQNQGVGESKKFDIAPLYKSTGRYNFAFIGTTRDEQDRYTVHKCAKKHRIEELARKGFRSTNQPKSTVVQEPKPGNRRTSKPTKAEIENAYAKCRTAWTGGHNPQVSSQCQAACVSRVSATLSQQAGERAAAQQYNRQADTYCSILSRWGATGSCSEFCR